MREVGVLALQGCIEPHCERLVQLGVEPREIRYPSELAGLSHLILPGGESTTMLRLIDKAGLWEPLREFGSLNAIWGVCAGAILVAKEVLRPEQKSLKLMDVRATRNYYGSQLHSFKACIEIKPLGSTIHADFIRAPLLEALSNNVEVLSEHKGQAVGLRQGRIMATAFHIELSNNCELHRYFLSL